MDAFQFNKLAGAVLGTVLVLIVISKLAGVIYDGHAPEKLGYPVQVTATTKTPGDDKPTEEPKLPPLAPLLASASADQGAAVAKKSCAACHTFEKGGKPKIGPNLYGIVGRKLAAAAGYNYSKAMVEKGAAGTGWDFEALRQFVIAPKKFLPGTKMSFPGLRRSSERADLLVYLRSLSDAPVPLPEAQAQPPAETPATPPAEAPAAETPASPQANPPANPPAEQPKN